MPFSDKHLLDNNKKVVLYNLNFVFHKYILRDRHKTVINLTTHNYENETITNDDIASARLVAG